MKSSSHPAARDAATAAVWAPWLAAPLFALLPIGGCGIAGQLQAAASPEPPAAAVTAAPVVPTLTASVPQVAWRRTAD